MLALLEVLRMLQPGAHAALYAQFLSDPTFFLTRFYYYWYEEANPWLWTAPWVDWSLPLRARTEEWARNLVLAVGGAAVVALFLTRRLRRNSSTALRASFVTAVACSAALVFVLLSEVAAVVGAVALGGVGIAIGIAVAVVVVMAMAGS